MIRIYFMTFVIQEMHHDLNLFYELCNTINENDQRQTHYLSSMFLTKFDI